MTTPNSRWVQANSRRRLDDRAPYIWKTHVFVGNGHTPPNATVIVRDGIIMEVGTGLALPPDARTVDARGLFVYPGLIDAMGVQGVRQPQNAAKATDTESAVMFPHVRAADLFDPAAAELSSWRGTGVLAMNVAPGKGVFMGRRRSSSTSIPGRSTCTGRSRRA